MEYLIKFKDIAIYATLREEFKVTFVLSMSLML